VFLSRLVKLNVDSNRRALDEENKRKNRETQWALQSTKTEPAFFATFQHV